MTYRISLLITFLGLVILVWVACSGYSSKSPTATDSANVEPGQVGTKVGNTAPAFKLTKMDGSEVALADLRGNLSVLIFWTAWCPVCKEEAPHFNALAEQYGPRGVQVLGINIQDSISRTQGGINDFGIRYAVARDPDASVARLYRVTGTPTIIFLDRQGVVQYFGNELPEDYSARLEALLATGE